MTCARDRLAHQLTDLAYATALAKGAGRYRAVCGHDITATSLNTPDGRLCPACLAATTPDHPTTRTRFRAFRHRCLGLPRRERGPVPQPGVE